MSKNFSVISIGILIGIISVIIFRNPDYLFVGLIYSALILISGIYYHTNKVFYWLSFICIIPLALLFYFQLVNRLLFLLKYVLNIKNAPASPLAFPYGIFLELPFLTLISFYLYNFYSQFRNKKARLQTEI
ncbi:hypothetical protein PW52_12020 [Tamlana sedimentorum]|uniref:Uncharacterized protein n=1 Tax=Neotamlana sedimentorum TaxID=1435349 RepID=A0A0D7W7I5_9FLAO|nr:hypothetical protein PW52_12020 [Tamlana sedimentorum]